MFPKRVSPQKISSPLAPRLNSPRKNILQNSLFRNNTGKELDKATPHVNHQSPEQKGYNEHIQNERMEKEDAKSRMDVLIKKSNRRIISIDSFSLIPFGFFMNTLEVEESRVIFIFKQPFTFQSHTLDISDISNVFIESAFFFATIRIVSRTFVQNDITIGYLNKHKAERVRKIIEGLRTLSRAKIDTSIYEIDELLGKLQGLNTSRQQ
jgi:hypothetical protein